MSGRASSEPVLAEGAPAPIGPYVPGRTGALSGRWVVTSGQIGLDPTTGAIVGGGIAAETEQVIQNLRAILVAGGSDLTSVVKTTVYLADMADFSSMNEVYARRFGGHKPARTTIAVKGLPLGCRVEIEAWAFEP